MIKSFEIETIARGEDEPSILVQISDLDILKKSEK